MSDLELLSNRVRFLERRLNRTRTVTVIAFILVAAVGIVRAQVVPGEILPGDVAPSGRPRIGAAVGSAAIQPIVENEVRARHFVLVDETGKERASLVGDATGSVFLVMFDSAGSTR